MPIKIGVEKMERLQVWKLVVNNGNSERHGPIAMSLHREWSFGCMEIG